MTTKQQSKQVNNKLTKPTN